MESVMTNKILAAVIVAASATLSVSAFAGGYDVSPTVASQQPNHPLTRAEVRQQLVDIEAAGYNPRRGNDTNYPDDAQAAEQRVFTAQYGTSGYGSNQQGSSDAGHHVINP
jgi:hypothetical protein